MPYGVTIKEGTGDTRVDIQCNHQSGMLYVVPAEASWVCQPENITPTLWPASCVNLWNWTTPE